MACRTMSLKKPASSGMLQCVDITEDRFFVQAVDSEPLELDTQYYSLDQLVSGLASALVHQGFCCNKS